MRGSHANLRRLFGFRPVLRRLELSVEWRASVGLVLSCRTRVYSGADSNSFTLARGAPPIRTDPTPYHRAHTAQYLLYTGHPRFPVDLSTLSRTSTRPASPSTGSGPCISTNTHVQRLGALLFLFPTRHFRPCPALLLLIRPCPSRLP